MTNKEFYGDDYKVIYNQKQYSNGEKRVIATAVFGFEDGILDIATAKTLEEAEKLTIEWENAEYEQPR